MTSTRKKGLSSSSIRTNLCSPSRAPMPCLSRNSTLPPNRCSMALLSSSTTLHLQPTLASTLESPRSFKLLKTMPCRQSSSLLPSTSSLSTSLRLSIAMNSLSIVMSSLNTAMINLSPPLTILILCHEVSQQFNFMSNR